MSCVRLARRHSRRQERTDVIPLLPDREVGKGMSGVDSFGLVFLLVFLEAEIKVFPLTNHL